jgi:NOL1/NOP2/fmu family ribosome biogenesis protein
MPDVPTAVPPLVVGDGEMSVWKMQTQIILQQMVLLEANMESAYSLIKGQCSKPILEKAEAQQGYAIVHGARYPIGLLELIKGVMFNYNSKRYRAMSILDIIKPDLVSQSRYMTESDYLEKFRTQLDVLRSAGGDLCTHAGMTIDELTRVEITGGGTPQELAQASSKGRQRFEAAMFLAKSNQAKYGRLVQELANDYNKGRDSYSESLNAAYELMLHDVRDQDSLKATVARQ